MQRADGSAGLSGYLGDFGRVWTHRFRSGFGPEFWSEGFAGWKRDCEWSWGLAPRRSGDEARYALQGEAQNILRRARGRQVHADHRLHLDDAGGDLDEAQAQGVELSDAPPRALWHRHAKPPHQPISAGVEEETELIGRRLGAGRAVRRQMRLPRFDVVFGLAASAVEIFVKRAGIALLQVGDDEARVGSFLADFDASDDPLDAAPTLRAIEELLEAAELAIARRGLEPRLRAGFEIGDMTMQRRGRREAEDIVEAVGATPIENLGAAIMAVGAQQDLGAGPVSANRAQQSTEKGLDLLAARPFGGTKHGGDEAALAVEHHDGLKAVFVVMRVEQPQLLAAMDRIERVVDIERDPSGNLGERLAIRGRPSHGPSATARERPAGSPTARSSIASTTPDPTASDRAPS